MDKRSKPAAACHPDRVGFGMVVFLGALLSLPLPSTIVLWDP